MQTLLTGTWNLSGAGLSCQAEIPGDFHSALLKANLIPDPYFGKNEQEILFLNRADFTIERTFEYKIIPDTKAILEITEADTIFDLFINGKAAGSGKNQFVRHRFDISSFVKNGTNKIKMIFHSAEKAAEEENKKLPYPVPYNKADVYSPNRNLIRKCQCHSGWDWGPCLMVSGIYGDIFIDTVSTGLFDFVKLNFSRSKKSGTDLWKIKAEISFDSFVKQDKDFSINVSGPDISEIEIIKKISLEKGSNTITCEIPVENPSVWKTSTELQELGLKENPVYFISVSFEDSNHERKSITKQFCFNALKCITKKEKSGGRSLYFENNGRKIFAKGTNWIPVDVLPSRWTVETYFRLIKAAQDSNMNCIRVWGGGIYEKDFFYQTCDRLGIIVWQDFMFACALYPVNDDFMENVRQEVLYQINRLQHYACIGIWCGNNENFGTLNWFPESRNNRDRYLVDYDRLYQGLIGKLVKEQDPARLWWPSSPSAGPDDFADNWHSDNQGDMHYWSVWHEKKNFSAYLDIRPRFVSEFGYESFPSLECIKTYTNKDDLNFTNPINEYHQRSPSGNTLMLESFARYFRFPEGFENQVYLSQVQQAVAIRTAVDWWRSLEPYCMGSLVWQINDVWPGPSWSSIDYNGNWKLLHYAQKDIFKTVHLAQWVKDGSFGLSAVNDFSVPVTYSVNIRFLNFDGTEAAPSILKIIKVESGTSKAVYEAKCETKNLKKDSYFVYAEFTATSENCQEFEGSTTVFPDLYKHCNIEKADITIEVLKENADFEITLEADKPVFFVSLNADSIPGTFSENCITLVPGIQKKITFTPESETSLSEFKKALSMKHLRDTYC